MTKETGTQYRLQGTYRVTEKSEGVRIDETFASRREAQFRKDDLEIVDFRGLSKLAIVEVQS
jgi:hypothetical protein